MMLKPLLESAALKLLELLATLRPSELATLARLLEPAVMELSEPVTLKPQGLLAEVAG
jgi:hypothetical protein